MTPGTYRWAEFSDDELDRIRDGLLGEAELDAGEDASFVAIVATAKALIAEIDAVQEMRR